MFDLILIASIVGGAAVIVAAMLWAYPRLGRRARAKGYRGPLLPVLFVLLNFVVFAVFVVSAILLVEDLPDAAIAPVSLAAIFATLAAATGIGAGVVRFLPERSVRRAGRRVIRTPYVGLGWLVLVVAFGLAITIFWTGTSVTAGLQLTMAGLMLSSMCFWAARRSRQPSLADVEAADERPPVLYLRNFEDDQRLLVWLPALPDDVGVSGSVLENVVRGATMDEFLRPEIVAHLGPLVALGDPTDYLPARGAAREYLADDDWEKRAAELMRTAGCIVAIPGTSEGLRWEFEHIVDDGLQHKLFVLTPPAARGPRARMLHATNRVGGAPPPVPWTAFAAMAAATGLGMVEDPGPGAIVGFDRIGVASVIARGAETALDYVRELA
ncbi:hypothetical protein [Virgisporangium aurantiacum]|uniref:Uncharacterized protein n=1 Tax=Virgisporangium aurantiacum TaxID=175570 RepID=A0A8J3Z9W9_9ACTN|nr:hypothetical protein [Virgisporangium aurantiacum]GIJ60076.1 hypothetical protein Vau01_075920 [Virgisporangium aurantiacum]